MTDPVPAHEETIDSLRLKVQHLEAQNARMRAALEPLFRRAQVKNADWCDDADTAFVTMKECRAAAEAIS